MFKRENATYIYIYLLYHIHTHTHTHVYNSYSSIIRDRLTGSILYWIKVVIETDRKYKIILKWEIDWKHQIYFNVSIYLTGKFMIAKLSYLYIIWKEKKYQKEMAEFLSRREESWKQVSLLKYTYPCIVVIMLLCP